MPASIFKGLKVKSLKDIFTVNDNIDIVTGDADQPNLTAKDHPRNTLYARDGVAEIYHKLDNGSSTNWALIGQANYMETVSVVTTYNSVLNDNVILCDTSGGGYSVNLPAAASADKKVLHIKKTTQDFNVLVINPNGAELIDGATTTTINTKGEALTIVCDGTGWNILRRDIPSEVVSYTPGPFSGIGTGASNHTFFWHRVGDKMVIDATIQITTAWTGTQIGFPIPAAVNADFTKIPSDTSIRGGGQITVYDPSLLGGYGVAPAHIFNTTVDEIRLVKAGTGSFYSGTDLAVNDEIHINGIMVPIDGWKS